MVATSKDNTSYLFPIKIALYNMCKDNSEGHAKPKPKTILDAFASVAS